MERRKKPLGVRALAVLALLGALLFVTKTAMAPLPNIEPVSLLVMVYAVVLGRKALFPIYIFVAMDMLIWGVSIWTIAYLYVWTVLYLLARCFRGMESGLGWAVLSGAFGLCFGLLCTIINLFIGGWELALTWWLAGIPFDVLHCAGNFVMALVLFQPCKKVLGALWAGIE